MQGLACALGSQDHRVEPFTCTARVPQPRPSVPQSFVAACVVSAGPAGPCCCPETQMGAGCPAVVWGEGGGCSLLPGPCPAGDRRAGSSSLHDL